MSLSLILGNRESARRATVSVEGPFELLKLARGLAIFRRKMSASRRLSWLDSQKSALFDREFVDKIKTVLFVERGG